MIKNIVFDISNVLAPFRYKEFLAEKGFDGSMIKRIIKASAMTPYWVEYEKGKACVTKKADGDYDISLTPNAAARLLLAGEGHTKETAIYINGLKLNSDNNDLFRAFPYRPTRFFDSDL